MPLGVNIITSMEGEEYDSNSCVQLDGIWAMGVGITWEQNAVFNKVRIFPIYR